MKTICPNCKTDSDLVTIESVDYIQCPECGWFETQADGSVTACDPPSSSIDENDTESEQEQESNNIPVTKPADLESEGDSNPHPSPSPSDDPVENIEDDEDNVTLKIKFED